MFSPGERVAIDEGSKMGTLRFLGPTQFRHGTWAGIELDQPLGKHDGTVQGVTYFRCPPNHGIFVHPSKVSRLSPEASDEQQPSSRPIHDKEDVVSRTPTRKRISLESGQRFLPLQTPIKHHLSAPPPSTILPSAEIQISERIGEEARELPVDSSLAAPKSSLAAPVSSAGAVAAIEVELRKRHLAMQEARQSLAMARMSLADSVQDYADFSASRERIFGAIDLYERSVAKYERQLKRYHQALQKERNASSHSLLGSVEALSVGAADSQQLSRLQQEKETLLQERIALLDKIEASTKRADAADDTCALLEQQLEETRALLDSAHLQLKQQSKIVAEINIDRMTLRKEVADLRGKLSALYEASSQGAEETEVLHLREENLLLRSQVENQESLISELNSQSKNKTKMIDGTMEELDRALAETDDTAQQLEATIKAKDEDIIRLKDEVALLKKEKNLASEQVLALQKKLVDYQDVSQLEASHQTRLESLRQSLEENWNRYQLELAEKDARIEELQGQALASGAGPALSPTAAGLVGADQIQKLAVALAELQHKYDELYEAKQKQEKYFTQQIAKLKRTRVPMDPLVEQPESPQKGLPPSAVSDRTVLSREGWEATEMSDLRQQVELLRAEKTKMEREKETEIYGFQLRLNRALKERDEVQTKLDDLQGQLTKSGPEVTILRREIEDLHLERELLKKALAEDRDKLKMSHADLSKAGEKMDALKSQLNRRTEESVKLEVEIKSMKQQMQILNQTIEHNRREQLSKSRLHDTEKDVLEKKISMLEEALALRKSDNMDKILREKADLMESLSEARAEVERLRETHHDVDYLRGKVRALEEELALRRERLTELEVKVAVAREEASQELADRDRYIRELEGRLAEAGREEAREPAAETDPESALKPSRHQTGQDSTQSLQIAALQGELEQETRRREKAERETCRNIDLLEIATKEMDFLQQKLAEFNDLDGQRKTLLVKYQAVREEIRALEERIAEKDDMITSLQAKLVKSDPVHRELSMSTSLEDGSDGLDGAKSRAEASAELEEVKRMNANLEHEKQLLEEELARVKQSFKQLKADSGVHQHQQLLAKAGRLIHEMVERQEESTWALIKPIKSLARFMRQFRPAEVDLERLRAEYESLRLSLASGERAALIFDEAVIGSISPQEDRPAVETKTKAKALPVQTRGEALSDSEDPMGGFLLSALPHDDPKPFSA